MNLLELAEEVQLSSGDKPTHLAEDVLEFGTVQVIKEGAYTYLSDMEGPVRHQIATFYEHAPDGVIISTVIALLQEK